MTQSQANFPTSDSVVHKENDDNDVHHQWQANSTVRNY